MALRPAEVPRHNREVPRPEKFRVIIGYERSRSSSSSSRRPQLGAPSPPAKAAFSANRGPSAVALSPSPAKRPLAPVAFTVGFHPQWEGEVGIECLAGEYFEQGDNHQRKVYKKQIPSDSSDDATEIFLYYWDESDGAAFSGWWFGDEVGGQRAWTKNPSDALTPPPTGWKVPWDGDAIPRDQPARGRRGPGLQRISRPDSATSSHVSEPPAGQLDAIGLVPEVKVNVSFGVGRSGRDPLRVGLASVVFPVLEIITGEALDSRAALTFVLISNYESHVLADGR